MTNPNPGGDPLEPQPLWWVIYASPEGRDAVCLQLMAELLVVSLKLCGKEKSWRHENSSGQVYAEKMSKKSCSKFSFWRCIIALFRRAGNMNDIETNRVGKNMAPNTFFKSRIHIITHNKTVRKNFRVQTHTQKTKCLHHHRRTNIHTPADTRPCTPSARRCRSCTVPRCVPSACRRTTAGSVDSKKIA